VDWSRLQLLTEDMNWGDSKEMNPQLLVEFDRFLAGLKRRFFVTSGTQGKHAEHSLHYSGRAVDFVFMDSYPGHILDAFLLAVRFGFTEIGLYPAWRFNGQTVGGMHLGIHEATHTEALRKKLWLGVPDDKGAQVYIGISAKNLVKYDILKGVK